MFYTLTVGMSTNSLLTWCFAESFLLKSVNKDYDHIKSGLESTHSEDFKRC